MKKSAFTRFLALALSLVLVASLLPVTAAAADNDDTKWLQSWAKSGGSVTLDHSLKLTDTVNVEGDLTIDLNGHTIWRTTGSQAFIVKKGATLRLKSSGSVGHLEDEMDGGWPNSYIDVSQSGDLYADHITFYRCGNPTIFTGNGGAINVKSGGYARLTDCTFDNCFGRNGGAIYINGGGSLYADRTDFRNCRAHSKGGAIYCCDDSTLYLDSCSMESNYAPTSGGAIRYGSNPDTRLVNCTLRKNWAITDCGGALCFDGGGGDVEIRSTSIVENKAQKYGGGIYVDASNATTLHLFNVTITGNTAEKDNGGGGIYASQYNSKYTTIDLDGKVVIQDNTAGQKTKTVSNVRLDSASNHQTWSQFSNPQRLAEGSSIGVDCYYYGLPIADLPKVSTDDPSLDLTRRFNSATCARFFSADKEGYSVYAQCGDVYFRTVSLYCGKPGATVTRLTPTVTDPTEGVTIRQENSVFLVEVPYKAGEFTESDWVEVTPSGYQTDKSGAKPAFSYGGSLPATGPNGLPGRAKSITLLDKSFLTHVYTVLEYFASPAKHTVAVTTENCSLVKAQFSLDGRTQTFQGGDWVPHDATFTLVTQTNHAYEESGVTFSPDEALVEVPVDESVLSALGENQYAKSYVFNASPGTDVAVRCVGRPKSYRLRLTNAVATVDGAAAGRTVPYRGTVTLSYKTDPPENMRWGEWQVTTASGAAVATSATTGTVTFSMPAEETTAQTRLMVKVAPEDPEKLTIEVRGADGAWAPLTAGYCYAGDTLRLTAKSPTAGFWFALSAMDGHQLTDSEAVVVPDNASQAVCAVPAYPVTVGVRLPTEQTRTLTVSTAGSKTVTRQSVGSVVQVQGEDAVVNGVTVPFSRWSVEGKALTQKELAGKQLTFVMPDSDVTLTAQYETPTHTATVSIPQLRLQGVWQAFAGQTLTIDAYADALEGQLDHWDTSGIDAGDVTTNGGVVSFTMPNRDVTLTATLREYTVTVSGGTADQQTAAQGEQVTLTSLPAGGLSGMELMKWVVEDAAGTAVETAVEATTQKTVFSMPGSNVTAAAQYGGSVTVAEGYQDDVTVTPATRLHATGETVKLSSTLRPSYYKAALGNGSVLVVPCDSLGNAKFTMPAANVTITPAFSGKAQYLKVIGGSGSGYQIPGTWVTATADDKASFHHWKSSNYTLSYEESLKPELTFTMPNQSVSLTAVSKGGTEYYYLTVENGIGSGWYAVGAAVSVLPKSTANHPFDHWEAVGYDAASLSLGTDHFYKFTMPANPVTLTAVGKYQLTVEKGSGGGWYCPGDAVTLTASHTAEHPFLQWVPADFILPDTVDVTKQIITFPMPAHSATVTAREAPFYDLTVNIVNGADTTATQRHYQGEKITLQAGQALEGHTFQRWYQGTQDSGSTLSTSPDFTFTMPGEDVTLTAVFQADVSYTVTVTGGYGGGTYKAGQAVTLTPTVPQGYSLDEWTLTRADGQALTSTQDAQGAVTFVMPECDVTAQAAFAANSYRLTVTDGTVTVDGAAASADCTVPYGASVTVTSVDKPGYTFDRWVVGSGDAAVAVATEASFSFAMPARDVALTAEFSISEPEPQPTYTVTVTGGYGGGDFHQGETVTLTPLVPQGYSLDGWTLTREDDEALEYTQAQGAVTFSMPPCDVAAQASFAANTYDLTVVGGIGGGTYPVGQEVPVQAQVPSGQEFVRWRDEDGVTLSTSGGFTYTMPAGDVTLTAEFAALTRYTVTVENGYGGGSYLAGETVCLTPVEVEGYQPGWTVAEAQSGDAVSFTENGGGVTFTMPQCDVAAAVAYIPKSYALTVTDGTVTVDGAAAEASSDVPCGAVVEVRSTPTDKQVFDHWTITPSGGSSYTATADPLRFAMPAGDMSVVGGYTPVETTQYTLTVVGGFGSGDHEAGDTVEVTAETRTGYTFVGWSSADVDLSASQKTANPLTFPMPEKDVTLTASFTPVTYPLTFEGCTATVDGGVIESGVSLARGTAIAFAATVPEGQRFQAWQVTVGDQTLTTQDGQSATFVMPGGAMDVLALCEDVPQPEPEPATYTVTVYGGLGGGVYDPGETVTVSGVEGKTFAAWQDVAGLTLTEAEAAASPLTFLMPSQNVTLTATYEAPTYPLSMLYCTAASGGEAVADGAMLEPGTALTLTADEAGEGLAFRGWMFLTGYSFDKTVGGDADGTFEWYTVDGQPTLSMTMPQSNLMAIVLYEALDYTVTVVGGQGGGTYAYGDPVTVGASAIDGAHFTGWEVQGAELKLEDGVSLRDDPLAFYMPAGDVTLTAGFAPSEYTLTLVNGHVTRLERSGSEVAAGPGATSVTVHRGDLVTVAPDLPQGEEFLHWQITGGATSEAKNTFRMPAGDVTLEAIHQSESYAVTVVAVDNAGAAIDGESAITGSGRYHPGDAVTLTAENIPGSVFDHWEVAAGAVALSAPTEAALTFAMPSEDVALKAVFRAQQTYALSLGSLDMGAESMEDFIQETVTIRAGGDQVTVTAHDETASSWFSYWEVYTDEAALLAADDPVAVDILNLTEEQKQSPSLSFAMPTQDLGLWGIYGANLRAMTVEAPAPEALRDTPAGEATTGSATITTFNGEDASYYDWTAQAVRWSWTTDPGGEEGPEVTLEARFAVPAEMAALLRFDTGASATVNGHTADVTVDDSGVATVTCTYTFDPDDPGEPEPEPTPKPTPRPSPSPSPKTDPSSPGILETQEHNAYLFGFVDGTVRPTAQLTRGEAAAIFFRLLTDEAREKNRTREHSFGDIPADLWCRTEVATLCKLGIIKGRSETVFDPGAPITRAEFAALASRFLTKDATGAYLFSDIQGHWAADEIQLAAQAGWVTGKDDGNFHPDDRITRAEAVTLINRMLGRVPTSADRLLAGMKTWPDNADANVWYYLPIQEASNSHDYVRIGTADERWTNLR